MVRVVGAGTDHTSARVRKREHISYFRVRHDTAFRVHGHQAQDEDIAAMDVVRVLRLPL